MFWRGRREVQLAVATLVLIPVVGFLAVAIADRSTPLRVEGAVAPRATEVVTATTIETLVRDEAASGPTTTGDFADAGGTVSAAATRVPDAGSPGRTTRPTRDVATTVAPRGTTVVDRPDATPPPTLSLRTTTTREQTPPTVDDTDPSVVTTETTQAQTETTVSGPPGSAVTTVPPDPEPASADF